MLNGDNSHELREKIKAAGKVQLQNPIGEDLTRTSSSNAPQRDSPAAFEVKPLLDLGTRGALRYPVVISSN